MVFKKILRKIREKKQPNADEKFKEFRGELSAICRNIAKSKDIGNVSKEEVKLARMQTEAGNLTISYHDTRFIESYKKAIDKYIKMVNARVEYISRLEKIGDEIRVDLSEIFDGQNTIEEVLYGKWEENMVKKNLMIL